MLDSRSSKIACCFDLTLLLANSHLKAILKLDQLRLRGPCGANDEFLLAATAQNLRKMAKLYMNGRKMSTA